jgi:ferric enterobactin receptor
MSRILRLALVAFMLLAFNSSLLAQDRTVSGTVLAEDDNNPLVGVTVQNQRTNQKTRTNSAGFYSIKANTGDVLTFTYVGYGRKQATVEEGKFVNVKMPVAEKQESIVTVYGIRREKRGLGYAAQELKGEDIAQTRRENFINSLAGRVPGAQITSTSGVPGASTSIILRGGTSMGLSNQPLFVIDGVPLDNNVLNQDRDNLLTQNTANRSSDYTNRAADMNPEDIESITVLKGPEAIALYGSDAGNGAIVITTKKGKAGKGTVTYDNSFKFDKVYRFHEVQSVYGRGRNGVANPFDNGTGIDGVTFTPIYFGPKYAPETPIYNNINNFFQTGFTMQHNISVEGGNEGLFSRLGAGYLKQEGVVPSSGFERFTIRFSNTTKITKKVTVTSTANYISSKTDKVSKGVGGYYLTLLTWPIDNNMTDYLQPNGSRKTIRTGVGFNTEFDNPYWDINRNEGEDKLNRILGNVNINYELSRAVSLTAIMSLDNYTSKGYYTLHPQSRFGVGTSGYFSTYNQTYQQLTGNFRTTIKKNFKDWTNTLTAGFYFEDNQRQTDAIKGERYIEPQVASINNTDPVSRDARLTISNFRKVRVYSNYVIGIKNMFFPSFALAYEGDSRLTSRSRPDKSAHYPFGSASASFVFSELGFIKDFKKLDYGKLRISYATSGKTGGIPPYIIDNSFQGQTTTGGGYAYGFTGNNFDLNPEFIKSLEYGFEMKFFKRRLGIDVTFFRNVTTDQILIPRISYGTGFILKYFNGGKVENKGMEIQLTGTPIQRKNFSWDVTVNFDRNRNKIIQMPKDVPTYYDSDTWVFGNLRSQQFLGSTISNLAGFDFRRNNNGDILISPTSGLPLIDGVFKQAGERQPDFQMGIINTINYKNFSLTFNIDIRKGGDVFNATELVLYRLGLSKQTLDRETPRVVSGVLLDGLENTKTPTKNTIVITPYYRTDYYSSTIAENNFIEDVNWLRMRDITISYKFPESVIKKQNVFRALSFYVTATDVFLITNYTGADPSVNSNNPAIGGWGGIGIDYGSLSNPRSMSFGFRCTF